MSELEELLDLASSLARDAGALLVAGMPQVRQDVGTKTSLTDMVTDMDRESEALIVSGLQRARPHDAIVAEEGGSQSGTSEVTWVIDPLDGTTNYLYGHPTYSVSIAAEVDGKPVVGVVADPGLDEVFTAARGLGATCNGKPITVAEPAELSTALVATGFGYDADRRRRQASVLTHVLPEVRDVRRRGVASLDLCWVACGRLDGYYEVGLQPWDLAAGMIIAMEAGAHVSAIDGGPPALGAVLASTPALAGPLTELLTAAGAADV